MTELHWPRLLPGRVLTNIGSSYVCGDGFAGDYGTGDGNGYGDGGSYGDGDGDGFGCGSGFFDGRGGDG